MNNFRGGFPGGNMQSLMKQAQKMQEDMQTAQAELAETTVTTTSGGGMVEVTMNGKKELVSIKLKKEAVDPDDVELLEDMITAAINDAYKRVGEKESEIMGPFSKVLGGII